MAKPNKSETAPAEATAAPAAEASATAAAAPATKRAAGGAAIMIEKDGVSVRRVDYIREEFAKGRKRGEIAKELGVAYQIVFAATKADKPADATPAEATGDAPAEVAAA